MSVAVCNEAFFIFLLFQVSSESLQAVTLSDLARSKGLSPINNWWGFITEPVGAAGSSLVIKLVDTLALNHSWNSGPIEALGGLCSLLGNFFCEIFSLLSLHLYPVVVFMSDCSSRQSWPNSSFDNCFLPSFLPFQFSLLLSFVPWAKVLNLLGWLLLPGRLWECCLAQGGCNSAASQLYQVFFQLL